MENEAGIPQARILNAVSANAGSYMLPNESQKFPFGLMGTVLGDEDKMAFLAKPLIVLLGTADTNTLDPELPHQAGAEGEGPYRLARGKYFYQCRRNEATELNAPFNWTIRYAPDIGHSDKGMAPFAVQYLFTPEKKLVKKTNLASPGSVNDSQIYRPIENLWLPSISCYHL